MKYLSVCSGIEAATVAWHPLGWTPFAFSEIDRFPSEVLAHHYGSNLPGEPLSGNAPPNLGDMTKFEEWPDADVDVLVGGTPCQSFSVAGLRKGIADPRGNLALTYLAILDRYRPTWMVWENVPGVLSSATHDGPDLRPPEIDLDAGHGPEDGEEVVVDDEYDADETHAFACFISGLQELGYGLAYRVLDAQFVTVDGFEHAVPQRRERVFVVGYLGDWRPAAAVFLEPESLRGDPAPRREAGKGATQAVAPSLTASGRGVERAGETRGQDPVVAVAFGGNRQSGPLEVSTAVNAHGGPHGRQDFESETFVAQSFSPPLTSNPYGDHESREGLLVAHSLRAEGFDASEDGTGRGKPIVPVQHPYTLAIRGRGDTHNLEYRQDGTANAILTPNGGRAGIGVGAIAFDTTQITSKANRSVPKAGDPCHPLAAGAHPPAIAFDWYASQSQSMPIEEFCPPLKTTMQPATQQGWAVRRLTPTECERLQGFPDSYTAILRNGKSAADGPRYKALGNSMAVNVMRWIGRRIEMVEALKRDLAKGEAA